MKIYVEVISGYLQNQGTPNGIIKLWHDLYQDFASGTCCVTYSSWNTDWSARAECIFRYSDSNVIIHIYSYSWGAGWGAMYLAKELMKRGRRVKVMILSDPVYRNRWLPWRAFLWHRIKVPANVQDGGVTVFCQESNYPRAHKLLPVSKIKKTIMLQATHQYMDDADAFHEECWYVLRREIKK